MTAAKHALAEGDFPLAARRLVYARDAEPRNTAVLRLLATRLLAGRRLRGRGPRGARLDPRGARRARRRTGPRRASTRTWARSRRRVDAAEQGERRARRRTPRRGSGSAGCGCARSTARARARRSSARARSAPTEQGLLDLALVAHLAGDVGAEVTACEQATQLAPESPAAWARYAHALARTDRAHGLPAACERALELADDPEVRDLRDQVARDRPARAVGAARPPPAEPATAGRRGGRRPWW